MTEVFDEDTLTVNVTLCPNVTRGEEVIRVVVVFAIPEFGVEFRRVVPHATINSTHDTVLAHNSVRSLEGRRMAVRASTRIYCVGGQAHHRHLVALDLTAISRKS